LILTTLNRNNCWFYTVIKVQIVAGLAYPIENIEFSIFLSHAKTVA